MSHMFSIKMQEKQNNFIPPPSLPIRQLHLLCQCQRGNIINSKTTTQLLQTKIYFVNPILYFRTNVVCSQQGLQWGSGILCSGLGSASRARGNERIGTIQSQTIILLFNNCQCKVLPIEKSNSRTFLKQSERPVDALAENGKLLAHWQLGIKRC